MQSVVGSSCSDRQDVITSALALIAQHLLGSRKGPCVSLVLVGTGPIGRNDVNSGHEHDLVGRDKAGGELSPSDCAIFSPARARGHDLVSADTCTCKCHAGL
jgi:hypothetical protein